MNNIINPEDNNLMISYEKTDNLLNDMQNIIDISQQEAW